MTVPLCGVRVDPNGATQSVTITDDKGATPTVYSDQYGQNTVALPKSISSPFTFYLPNPGTWTVAGTTITLEGSQVGSVTYATTQSGANGGALPTAPAAVSKALRIMAPFDDGTLRDYSSTSATATNAASPLTTPTYDGSGQIAEIDIEYFPEGWGSDSNGKAWKYWMINGPYPGGASNYENPCILVSDDGQTWQVPPGLTNPIAGTTTGSGNSDCSLFVDVDGTMYAFWAHNLSAPCDLQWSKSTDGIHWTAFQTMLTVNAFQLASPQIVYDGTQYWMFLTNSGSQVLYATASSPTGFTSAQFNTNPTHLTGLPTATPSHCNFRYWNGHFYGILSDGTHIYYGYSTNGSAWAGSTTPVLSASASGWDVNGIYRTAFLIGMGSAGPCVDLWYTARNATNVWGVGYARMALQVSGGTINGAYTTLAGSGTQAATAVPLSVKAAASQSADLQQWQNNAGAVFLRVTSSGQVAGGAPGAAVQILESAGGNNFLRMLNTPAWSDSKSSTFFQVGKGSTDYLLFSTASGNAPTRWGFVATQFAFSNATYNTIVPPATNALASFSTSGGNVLNVLTSGQLQTVAANEATGAGSAALGANCPATTLTAPTTWEKITTSSGAQGYFPVWV